MITRNITYTNWEGEEVTTTCYFNLTQAEIYELEAGHKVSFSDRLRQIVNEKDSSKIIAIVKEIIMLAYGEKNDAGKFVKNQDLRDAFASSEEYSVLFEELAFDAKKLGDFVNGIMPKKMVEQAEMLAKHPELVEKYQKTGSLSKEDIDAVNKGGDGNVININEKNNN